MAILVDIWNQIMLRVILEELKQKKPNQSVMRWLKHRTGLLYIINGLLTKDEQEMIFYSSDPMRDLNGIFYDKQQDLDNSNLIISKINELLLKLEPNRVLRVSNPNRPLGNLDCNQDSRTSVIEVVSEIEASITPALSEKPGQKLQKLEELQRELIKLDKEVDQAAYNFNNYSDDLLNNYMLSNIALEATKSAMEKRKEIADLKKSIEAEQSNSYGFFASKQADKPVLVSNATAHMPLHGLTSKKITDEPSLKPFSR